MIHLRPKAIAWGRSHQTAGWRKLTLAALALTWLAGPGVLRASQEKLPKAETILDKYVEATGGKAAYQKIKNRVTKGTFEMPAQGLKFAMTICAARPNKFYSLMESEAFGKIEKGTDGEVAWEMNPMMGPQIKEGEERTLMLRSAAFDAVTGWRKLFKKAACVGMETVDGKPCYKIVLTPDEGQPETRYYDKESGLLVKTEMTLTLPMGTIPFESYPGDYKRVDGILLPHKTRVAVMGTERTMTMESIEHNVKMPADRFNLPDEIQKLLEKKKGEGAQSKSP